MELNIKDLSNENFDMDFDPDMDLTSINLDIPSFNKKMNLIKQNRLSTNSYVPKSILKKKRTVGRS
jgi:hypothetical protein